MKKKTVKLVSAVVVLGVLCAAYEGVNFYVTSQEDYRDDSHYHDLPEAYIISSQCQIGNLQVFRWNRNC